jgi:hypothetical protein
VHSATHIVLQTCYTEHMGLGGSENVSKEKIPAHSENRKANSETWPGIVVIEPPQLKIRSLLLFVSVFWT